MKKTKKFVAKGGVARAALEFRDQFLEARFEEASDLAGRVSWPSVTRAALSGSPKAMSVITMAAELSDYFGDVQHARKRLQPLVKPAETRLRRLVAGPEMPGDRAARSLSKQWVWVVLQCAFLEYRDVHLMRALELCRLCEAALQKIRSVPAYSCYGTLSRIQYLLGLIYREQFRHEKAKSHFLQSIDLAWESLREKNGAQGRALRQSRWTDVTVARSLALGLGFVYQLDGQPHLALPVLLAAKNILARVGEKLLSAYIDVIYFDAKRSLHAFEPDVVDETIEGLKGCYRLFVARGHDLYGARAAYSLAMALVQRARPDEDQALTDRGATDLEAAEAYADALKAYAATEEDRRTELYSMLCRSRILRKRDQLTAAEEMASRAIDAGGDVQEYMFAGLLMARAEARARMLRVDASIADFDQALALTAENPRARAVCLLRLAALHATKGNLRSANRLLEQWRDVRPRLGGARMLALERKAVSALEPMSQDLNVRMSDEGLDPTTLARKLHSFLAEWARRRTPTDDKAADLLRVSRQTLLTWGGPRRGRRD